MPHGRRSAWSRGPGIHRAALLAALALCAGCRSARYGIGQYLRSGADHEQLDAERAAAPRSAPPGELAAGAPPPYWTQYRGPRGDGVYDEGPLELDWPESGPPLLWRRAVGPAYSSIVAAAGLAVTMEQRRASEAVVALALETGAVVWEHAWAGRFYEAASKEGPRATPAIADGLVVALGAEGELRCLELATGALRWRRDLLEGDVPNLEYGLAASPRVDGGLVFAQGADGMYAFELSSGERRWRALAERMAYATPQLGEVLGRPTLLVTTAERVVGLAPESGEELWSFPWRVSGGNACTQPVVVAPDRVLVSAGYGRGSQLVQLEQTADGVAADLVWRSGRFKTRFDEPVLVGDHAYGLDEGKLACLEVATGELAWKRGSYGYGQLLALPGHLLVVAENGGVHLLLQSVENQLELRSFPALEGSVTLVLPALAHGLLLLRDEREVVCFDLRRPEG